MVLTLNTLADEFSAMFGEPMDGNTLSDLYRCLAKRAQSSTRFHLAEDSPIWMELSDGLYSRSVIRETGQDKKTYHEGHLLETFGSLNGADIQMGKQYTQVELTFTDAEDNNWVVSTCWERMPTGLVCCVDGVRCPLNCFEYIHDSFPSEWTPGGNTRDLKGLIRV